MSITNNYGGVQVLSEDATYVYVEVKLPQGALMETTIDLLNTYQWSGGGNLVSIPSWLNWDPASVKSPAWGSSPGSNRQKADGTSVQQRKLEPVQGI
ncbi:hypothetical protein ACLB1Q_34715 [Escherichia coli]